MLTPRVDKMSTDQGARFYSREQNCWDCLEDLSRVPPIDEDGLRICPHCGYRTPRLGPARHIEKLKRWTQLLCNESGALIEPLTETQLRKALVYEHFAKPDELTEDQVRVGLRALMNITRKFLYIPSVDDRPMEDPLTFSDPAAWRCIEERFRDTSKSSELSLTWTLQVEPTLQESWSINGTEQEKLSFSLLISRAVVVAGLADDEVGHKTWFNLLRRGGRFDSTSFDDAMRSGVRYAWINATLSNAQTRCADLCFENGTRAMALLKNDLNTSRANSVSGGSLQGSPAGPTVSEALVATPNLIESEYSGVVPNVTDSRGRGRPPKSDQKKRNLMKVGVNLSRANAGRFKKEQIAERLGISVQTVSSHFSGKYEQGNMLLKYAELFGVSIDALLPAITARIETNIKGDPDAMGVAEDDIDNS
jgi:hypothetical protein